MIALISALPPMPTVFTWDRTIFHLSRRGGSSIQFYPILSLSRWENLSSFAKEWGTRKNRLIEGRSDTQNNHLVGNIGHEERFAVEERTETRKLLIGYSTHNLSQVIAADALAIDYIAIGPVFATGSKANPDPVIGWKV